MAQNEEHRIPEHGYGMGYQESVEIESRALFGMETDEFYRRQVGLVLDEIPPSLRGGEIDLTPDPLSPNYKFPDGETLKKKAKKAKMKLVDKCNLNLGPGKRVLDLAVGQGDTSRYLATSGADVVARELEPDLVKESKEEDQKLRQGAGIEEVQQSIRAAFQNMGEIEYAEGNYGDIQKSLDKEDKFDVVSVMSRSFIYLGERENYEKALKDFFKVLSPGGKVVIQSREHLKSDPMPWADTLGSYEITPEGDFLMKDHTGASFAWRKTESETLLSDGVKQSVASRYLIDSDGNKKELGTVTADDHLKLQYLEMWTEMLRDAGFQNVSLKMENLSSNGNDVMFAIVAEKPDGEVVPKQRSSFGYRVKNLLGL